MAKKGKIQHNNLRKQKVETYRAKRADLRKKSKDLNLTIEERMEARQKLAALPRFSAENRVRNRCELTGRPRGYMGKFGLSRIKFREMALAGELPGVTKSSW